MLIENEKYIVRRIEEKDIKDVIELIKDNKFLGRLWSVLEQEGKLDETIVKPVYIDSETSFGVFNKSDGTFCGYIEVSQNSAQEGELSVRVKNNAEMKDIISLFGEILVKIGYQPGQNLTLQYTFE